MVMRLCWCPQSTVRALMRLRTGWGVTPGFGMIGIKSMNYRSSHAASSPSSWSRQGPTAHTLHWTKCIHLSIHSLWLYMRHLSPHRINYDKTLGSDSHNHNLYCTVEVSRLLSKTLTIQCNVWRPCLPGQWQNICLCSVWQYRVQHFRC